MRRTLAILPLLLLLLLTGCTGSGSSTASSAGSGASSGGRLAAPAPQKAARGSASGGASGSSSGSSSRSPSDAAVPIALPAPKGASVVRTGELDVAVADVPRAADEAGRLTRALGGVVEADERSTAKADGTALLRLRLPPAAFEPSLARFAALGTERSRSLGSADVTDQVVDLQARLTSQRASVARIRALLDRATTVGQVVEVEGELTRRTADLESLEARSAALADRVALSTLTLRLTTRAASTRAQARTAPLGFGDGLRGGWDALTTMARGLAVGVGALLPFSPLLLLAAGIVWWRTRTGRVSAP